MNSNCPRVALTSASGSATASTAVPPSVVRSDQTWTR